MPNDRQQQLITAEQLHNEEEMMARHAVNAERRRREERAEFDHRYNVKTRLAMGVFIFAMGVFALMLVGAFVFVIWRFVIRT